MSKPTEKMARFAQKIAWGIGMDDPPAEAMTDYNSCAAFIKENKDRFYRRHYEHDKWLRDMEASHRPPYASEYNMPYAEGVAASDYGIFPWGNS